MLFIGFPMSGLKSVVLTRGNASWRLTRFSDDCFVAKNGFGKKHVFRSGYEMTHFEDFLLSKGFTHLQRGRSLSTLKKQPAVA